jgi:hypothetical protein
MVRDTLQSVAEIRRGLWTLLIVAVVGVAACDNDVYGPGGAFSASDSFRFDVSASGLWGFYLEGTNGDVRVLGAPNTSNVVIQGRRRVNSFARPDAHQRLNDIAVDLYEEDGELIIRTLQPSADRDHEYIVHYEILVPEWFLASVYNVNGLVTVERLAGGVVVVNSNGPLELFDVLGSAIADNINGDIIADISILGDEFIDLRTVNGNIFLDIPFHTSAWLEASLTNGEILVQNLNLRDQEVGNGFVSGRLGSGEGEIDLLTTNGNIRIRGY